MALRRTVDLLPEIFRTSTNKQFLSATLDQLTQEPSIKRTQGYVGRRVGPGVNPNDNYVVESTATRTDYQLEPAVVFLRPDTNRAEDAITYPGMLDALALQGATTQRQDRLFESQYYAWDPFCDLDKFTNYSQYYWLPQGPDSVDIGNTNVPTTDAWTVTRGATGYEFSDVGGVNPILTLVRGGSYQFFLNQTGRRFWIQAAVNTAGQPAGTMPGQPNISSRDVLGVDNNGEDLGTITFNVPPKTAQDFYFGLQDIGLVPGRPPGTRGTVDLITNLKFNQINNVFLSEFLAAHPDGIDGITNLNNRTVVFTNPIADAEDGGWQITTQFDPLPRDDIDNGLPGSFDYLLFDQTTDITSKTQRYSVWLITYEYDTDGNPILKLSSVLEIADLTKFRVLFGTEYSNTQWYKNASGFFQRIPLLTAILDTLYYQDADDPEFFGRILLIDPTEAQSLDLDEIIGSKNYTSPNGVVFTNGLKVQLRGAVVPERFQNLEFYVEGVGTGPGIDARVGFVDGAAYFGPWHTYLGRKMTGTGHSATTFQQYIYETLEESIVYRGSGGPQGAALPQTGVPGANIGNGIRLLPVEDFVTPETYTRSGSDPFDSTPYDAQPFDETLNAPEVQDYITMNRACNDRNAWARSNRWFHIDVIRATAEYNNDTPVLDNNRRGKRPIIEFRANLDLYNFGTQGKDPVNIIDFSATDAFSNINGQLGYSTDGYSLINGSRIIFAADLDPAVRNKIYVCNFIDPDGDPNSAKIINLTPAIDGDVLTNQTVVCLSGNTQQGKSYWFDGSDWILAQQKTNTNQAPLFDVFDINGHSLGDRMVYPSSTFAGSKIFGYALGDTQITDSILGFSLRYLNLNNVGDIVFENYFYTDTFLYVKNSISTTENISQGFLRQYIDRVSFTNQIGWQPAALESRQRQVFRFVYDGTDLVLDIPVDNSTPLPALQIYQGNSFIDPTQYTYSIQGPNTIITLLDPPANNTVIEVQALSPILSQVAYYQIPNNLENNALNANSPTFTLGTIRTHYETIGQNLKLIQGDIVGANNTRDLGNILIYGTNIIQNSSPLPLAGAFLRQQQLEVISAIRFNSQEYEKYKAQLLNLAAQGDFINLNPTQVLDRCMTEIALGRNEQSPFYWSDMLPFGQNYSELVYQVTPITIDTFDTRQIYDYTSSNFLGLLVYVNDRLLTRGYEYEVAVDSPTFTISVPLSVGDVVTVREFSTTYGNYVPNTPTKMGLYPSYRPEIYLDTSYLNPTRVIRGHDGSITVAFDDYRDQVLLEFETRIFNNLKITSEIPLQAWQVIPGQFRTTEYDLQEINTILSTDFLSWVGWNKLDYPAQTYINSDAFTYNYSQSANKLNRRPLLGAWRGIYNYFYDTTAPNTRPWEMLGFSQEPDWWQGYYGPAPYTSGNLVLWDDLSQGLVRDPAGEYYLPQYVRPDLTAVIPSGSEGELLPPLQTVTGNYDATSFRRSWAFGDDGSVENVWRTSSSWPFAVMRLLALTKPAKFFSLFADRDRYVYDPALQQYLWNGRYRLDAKNLAPIYGNGVSRASYINWIVDYNRQLGVNSTSRIESILANLDIRLAWRMGAFGDKKYLQIYTERSTPNSLNTSLLLPDESYQLLLYRNQPFGTVAYSSVIIQLTDNGYQVLGYSSTKPYFEVLSSLPNGNLTVLTVGSTTVRVALDHSDQVVQIPYGYTFLNRDAVCDFLISYGKLLEQNGFQFTTRENGYIMDWYQMAQEFLYWSQQGWAPGSIINLNPSAVTVSVTRPGAVADAINTLRPENLILNQNRLPLPANELVIERLDNTFRVTSLNNNTISYINLSWTAYEHLVILDNVSIFADLIYNPTTGARQSRVLVAGNLSGDWNGTVNAPGFVLNQDNIPEWLPNQTYTKGEIVLFKNEYWAASTIIQPSQEFDYTLWLRSDYDQIQKGLLPNAANASDQLATAYDVYSASLQTETDLFSFGLVGFRPREYMQALNLSDVSQVQLYQQFLGTKGTTRAAEIFSLADLGKETAEYSISEYWAMLKSQYGATANRNYVEIRLDESRLRSDPSLIEIIQPQQSSAADQTVLVENLWKTSQPLSSPDILPTTVERVNDTALPTAGYVNLDDVDYTVFSLEEFATADDAINDLTEFGVGSTVWTAKSNNHDWNVYRADAVPGRIVEISDNLNGRALVTFSSQHGLIANDILIIRFFSNLVDGTYRVASVPSPNTLLINYVFLGQQVRLTGQGLAFTLVSSRVAQPSDIVDLPFANEIIPGNRAWVDDDGSGLWAVLEKRNPFGSAGSLPLTQPVAGSGYGLSVAQGFGSLGAMVGAPLSEDALDYLGDALTTGFDFSLLKVTTSDMITVKLDGVVQTEGVDYSVSFSPDQVTMFVAPASNSVLSISSIPGSIYTYVKTALVETYAENTQVDLSGTIDAAGLGNDLSMGNTTWAVAGASASRSDQGYALIIYNPVTGNAFAPWQLLIRPVADIVTGADEFGFATAISQDERWLYVSAPGANRVYAYGRVDVQSQNVDYISDGATITYNYSDYIKDATPAQINVAVEGVPQILGVDYALTTTNVSFFVPPTQGFKIDIARRLGNLMVGDGFNQIFNVDDVYGTTDINSFAVYVDEALQRPDYDYILVGTNVIFFTAPALGAGVRVRSDTWFRPIYTIDGSALFGLGATARFGHSIAASTDGRQVMIGAPGYDSATGRIYVFDRCVERFLVDDAAVLSYTTQQSLASPGEPIFVQLNGEFLVNNDTNINGDFTVSGNTVTLISQPQVGDELQIHTNQFALLEIVDSENPTPSCEFGASVDLCGNNCSLYVGAPNDSTILPEAGMVEFHINQSRVWGTNTSLISNGILTPAQSIRINDYWITLDSPTAWNINLDYPANAFVSNAGGLFKSTRAVPENIDITNVEYWTAVNWSAVLAHDINTGVNGAGVPNVSASLTDEVTLVGDSYTKTFSVGSIYSAAASYTTQVYINNVLQVAGVNYDYDNATETVTFAVAPLDNAVIKIVGGRLIVTVINLAASVSGNRLTILPGIGSLFNDLAFDTYAYVQTLVSPVPQDYAHFGHRVNIATSNVNLVVGAPDATALDPTTFDGTETYFDANSTDWIDPITQSGAVYTFDLLPSAGSSLANPPRLVFGQQIVDTSVDPLDRFGAAIDYTSGILLVGSPGEDLDDSSINSGRVADLRNINFTPAWQVIRQQQPVVDINLLNSVFMYDVVTNGTKQYFDYFDPLQGRMLGAIAQNLDFTGSVDPASYNVGPTNNFGQRWGQERVGQIWWDVTNTRFIDPNQDDITYASRRWGQLFPGSTVDVYQWISSSVPPAQYQGPGQPRNTVSYSVVSNINEQGIFGSTYFFWVSGIRTVNRQARKTLSIETLTRYIEAPRSSGIAYIAPINASTVAIYNGLPYISAQDTILHVEYDQQLNDDAVHFEYHLIPQDRDDGFLTPLLYDKLLDSFCGVDTVGNLVPAPFLPISEKYGVAFRPRQSMFANRFLALQNYLIQANSIMAQFPLAETRHYPLLQSAEPQPSAGSGAWNKRVANLTELSYQDLNQVPIGYLYLVESDSSNNGLWTIYQVQTGALLGSRALGLIRVQNYDTRLYWHYINWYLPGFDTSSVISAEVANYADLATLDLPAGSVVKVTSNAQGKFEIYLLEDGAWLRVGLQDGTIEINSSVWDYTAENARFGFDVEVFDAQYFDQEPVIETRKILQSINQEIFVDDLRIERNRLLILMFNYILSEQIAPIWLTKTSLIDVAHVIRNLEPFQIYRQDNQDFVLNYIQEVKPYHTQIKEFNLIYKGNDVYDGTVTDFDVPAYYDTTQARFISPVLDEDLLDPLSTTSSVDSANPIWQQLPWNQWYQNYQLSLRAINVIQGGSNYTVPPQVLIGDEWQSNTAYSAGQQFFYGAYLYTVIQPGITGTIAPTFTSGQRNNGTTLLAFAGLVAQASARINSAGQVSVIIIDEPGQGYISTPMIALVGGNGSGARAAAVLGNNLVRSLVTTIKYDRYQYQSTLTDWQPNTQYDNGDLVRYDDRVWQASSDDSLGVNSADFDPQQWTLIPAGVLSGVDRTMGYYVPEPDMPGLDLALLISGVDYPGVQVMGPDFDQNTGFDVGNYDINPYDNIAYGPEGRPTYDPAILDAIYESQFEDSFLGTLPAPAYDGAPVDTRDYGIDVSGGAFVDTFSSHAPEELVPGAIFDTLDFRVFTTPGSDWQDDGHGFAVAGINYQCTGSGPYSFAGVSQDAVSLELWNQTNGTLLNLDENYTVDWVSAEINVISGAVPGDVLVINLYGLGGSNQLYKSSYVGDTLDVIPGCSINVPVPYASITSIEVTMNGSDITEFAYEPDGASNTTISFAQVFPVGNIINIQCFGPGDVLIYSQTFLGNSFSQENFSQVVVPMDTDLIVSTVVFVNGTAQDSSSIMVSQYSTTQTLVTFSQQFDGQDLVVLALLGETSQDNSWSSVVTTYQIADGSSLAYDVSQNFSGTNPANIIVCKNGIRARPAEGIEYTGDGSTTTYFLPTRGGYAQDLIADNEVSVYVNNVALVLGVDFVVDPIDISSDRTVTLTTAPASAAQILISVNHAADYYMNGNVLIWRPTSSLLPLLGDVISFTTFNDTSQQDLLTQVFQGPTTQGLEVSQGYDTTDYDIGNVTDAPGSFDFGTGSVIATNRFDLGRSIIDSNRLWVTLDGKWIFENVDYIIDGTVIEILGPPINAAQVVAITSMTNSTVPGSIAFRIFQDMRGGQYTYRILPRTTTTLVQDLGSNDDTIYVADASALSQPNLENGIFGIITIDGERITYRTRDLATNTVSGLRRGTAGTAADNHSVGASVYDMGIGNLLPMAYQDQIDYQDFLGDGTMLTFQCDVLSVSGLDSTELVEAVQIYVGGTLQIGGYTIDDPGPLTVTFDTAPPAGYQVSIRVRRALSWYQPGPGTASDGIALQEQTTLAGEFFRGN